MPRILVTGATGFVGKHLIPALYSAGHDVLAMNSQSGNVTLNTTWSNYPSVEVVIHLAAKSFVPDSWAAPASFIDCNLLGTIAALDYCRANNARLIFLSSYLYGSPEVLPIPETAKLVATNPYALSKKLSEEACQFYAAKFGINIVILRPFNVYGPGQRDDFLIPSIIRQANEGESVRVKDLEPRRDYVFIDDLIDVIVKSVELRTGVHVLNVGSGVSHSVAELIEIIQDAKGTDLPVFSSNERRQDEVMDTIADIANAQRLLNWTPKWALADGIREILIEKRAGLASHD
jgi:nucleoside-diphosphate-sugar epimerase